jgi:hypothetical protein
MSRQLDNHMAAATRRAGLEPSIQLAAFAQEQTSHENGLVAL